MMHTGAGLELDYRDKREKSNPSLKRKSGKREDAECAHRERNVAVQLKM